MRKHVSTGESGRSSGGAGDGDDDDDWVNNRVRHSQFTALTQEYAILSIVSSSKDPAMA